MLGRGLMFNRKAARYFNQQPRFLLRQLYQPIRCFSGFAQGPGGKASSEDEAKNIAKSFMKKVDDLKIIDEIESINEWKIKVMDQ